MRPVDRGRAALRATGPSPTTTRFGVTATDRRRWGLRAAWLLALLTTGGAVPAAAADAAKPPAKKPAPPLCLTGGQIIDPKLRVVTAADVVIKNGVIAQIGPRKGDRCPGKRIDVTGKVVMPGLIDMHVHGWGNPSPTDAGEDEPDTEGVLAKVLTVGVMATLDLAGDDEQRIGVRDRLRGSPNHAALFVGAALMAHPGRAGRPAPSEEELRAKVRARAALHPDVIKIISTGGVVAPIIDEARKLGLPTVVHISEWDQARAALQAGATAITHLEDEVIIPDDLLAAWAKQPTTWSIPTMVVQCDLARIVTSPARLTDPLLVRVTTPALRSAYQDEAHFTKRTREWIEWQTAGCVAHDFQSLRLLQQNGVGILAGSDTGNLGTFQGYSLHREIELMSEAGLPTWDALRSATTNAAAFLNIRWGIEPGDPANLLVLAASPLTDIGNTRQIVHIIHLGHPITVPAAKP
jgi:imidazolonepropionase-like amidohydrolase